MSVFASKIVGVTGGAALVSAGSYWLYSQNLPKDFKEALERDGYSLASTESSYKALVFERKSELPDISLDLPVSLEDAFPKLRSWCEDQYRKLISGSSNLKGDKERILKFCGDRELSVRGKLIKAGKDVFFNDTEDEDYKVTFALYKYESKFLELMKTQDPSLTASSDNETGKDVLKKWCISNFSKDSNIPFVQISWYCSPSEYKTVFEKLSKESWKKADESGNSEIWQQLFEIWKNTKAVTDSIKKHSEDNDFGPETQKSVGGEKLKAWCEVGLDKKLYEDGVYQEQYKLIKSVCTGASLNSSK